MRPFGVILIGFMIVAEMSLARAAQESFDLQNMTCSITSADRNGCTGMPTLHAGILAILKQGTFKLEARYEGCFMVENVTKSGKYEASRFKETISLELLATTTTGMKDTISDFPRTLGFANLNYDKLDGYFVDLSAVIHGRGRHTENITTSKLQCEVKE